MRSHEAQTRTTSKRPRLASRISSSSPGRLAFVLEILSVISATIYGIRSDQISKSWGLEVPLPVLPLD